MNGAWHHQTIDETLAQFEAHLDGLSEDQAARRLARVGPNQLTPSKPVSALAILVDQLTSIVVVLLAVAAVISLLLGDRVEAAAIVSVLVINTALGFVIDLRARRAMDALLQFEVPHAAVVRAGRAETIEARRLVPGDIIELNAGQAVPADARLATSSDLRTMEAALTGESLPISKDPVVLLEVDAPLAERTNMIYKGTTVAAGTGRAVVTATGERTEIGRIGVLVATIGEEKTPLERRLDALGRRLVWLALGVAALVAGLSAIQGAPLGLVVELGIALAVAAVPEGLPAVVTIALAVGLRRMARRHALVRRLPAVEALGSATVICTDKTRTLTSGEMTVARVWAADVEFDIGDETPSNEATDARLRRALEVALLASRPQRARTAPAAGMSVDPVDTAVERAAARIGLELDGLLESRPMVGLVPFSSERRLMASFHQVADEVVAYVKGAPRRLLELSTRVVTAEGDHNLNDAERERIWRRAACASSRWLLVPSHDLRKPRCVG